MMVGVLRNIRQLAIAVALLAPPAHGLAQDYLYDQWGVKEGLPQNTVNQILQTRDGYLWIATEGGLARFDGMKFTTFNTENTPALKGNRVNILFENINGDLLIGSYRGGLTIYRNNQFFNLGELEALQNHSIYQFVADNQNRLWVFLSNVDDLLALDIETYEPIPDVEQPIWDGATGAFSLHDLYLPVSFDTVAFYNRTDISETSKTRRIKSRSAIAGSTSEITWTIDQTHLYHCTNFECTESFEIPNAMYRNNKVIHFSKTLDKIYIGINNDPDLLVFDIPSKTFSILEAGSVCPNGAIFQVFCRPRRQYLVCYLHLWVNQSQARAI